MSCTDSISSNESGYTNPRIIESAVIEELVQLVFT